MLRRLIRLKRITAAVALGLMTLLSINVPLAVAATQDTWTGASCSTTNCNWSNASNWSAGAPISGYDLIFDNTTLGTYSPVDDINGLSVNSITFINNLGTAPVSLHMESPLVIVDGITQASSVTSNINTLVSTTGTMSMTLGADATFASTGGLYIGNAARGDSLALNSHTLTVAGGAANSITSLGVNITGSGALIYNAPDSSIRLFGTNSYSGTTQVIASKTPVLEANATNGFGTSALTIQSAGSVSFNRPGSGTISNNITINGVSSGTLTDSLNVTTPSNGITLALPNIVLVGGTRFTNNTISAGVLTINLAGITTSGACIEYGGYGNNTSSGAANGFINAPSGCALPPVIASSIAPETNSVTPKTPATGFGFVQINPALVLIVTAASSGVLVMMARQIKRFSR